MIPPARLLALKPLGAVVVTVTCCVAFLVLAPSVVHAQGGDYRDTEEQAEEATNPEDSGNEGEGEASGEDTSGEGSGDEQSGQTPGADPETQDAIDEASRGDSGAQGSVAEDRSGSEDGGESSGDGDGGFLNDIAVDMLKSIGTWIGDGIQAEAEKRTENMTDQIRDGRYQIDPPSNDLTEIYEGFADWAKFAAIPLLLLLGLSMTLRGANYDTAYAVQTGLPKIITMIAGMAFMPEIIGVIADVSREISNAVIDQQAMEEGFNRLIEGQLTRAFTGLGGIQIIVWLIKLILSVLILFAVAFTNLVFGILYVIGPLALIFYAIPRFSDVAAAWFRGILACFAISVLWAVEFGVGFRFIGDPTLLYEGTGSSLLPLLFNVGLLWLIWKTPWYVFQWAFYSYSAGGGGGGMRGAMTAVSLFKLFRTK